MAQNIFAQGMDAFDRSYDRTQGFFDQAARRKAGQALAGGDRAGAMQAMGNVGNVDAVRTMQGDQRREEDAMYERGRDMQADERQAQQDKIESAKTLLEASSLLGNLPEEQRWQVFSTHPLFQSLIPDEMRAQIKPEHLSNEGLQMFAAEVKSQMVNLGGGGVAEYTPGQGLKVLREPDPKLVQVREGTTLIDPETRQPIYTKPKTYAPPRAGGGGSRKPGAFVPKPTGKVY